jgi:hypothetical protein
MDSDQGWGRVQGKSVYSSLIDFVENHPGVLIFQVSLVGVKRVDISFASETIVELANRYRKHKGFCFIDLTDQDMIENWEAAAERKNQPLIMWHEKEGKAIGPSPAKGALGAFDFAMQQEISRASDFVAANPGMTIANASMKFKQLWENGFLLRQERVAESGGIEFVYFRAK